MKEVSIKLQGGMANYMFQIAAAHAYALRTERLCMLSAEDASVIHKNIDTYKNNQNP